MKKVTEEQPYLSDNAHKLFDKIDFADTFATTNHMDSLQMITNLIFNTTPKWVSFLFIIRNKIVKFFGLKTGMPDNHNEDFIIGGYISFFKIYKIADDELILGANDSHLNFRAIINNTKSPSNNIKVTTLVEYNNVLGKIYMTLIAPFHRLVVKQLVKKAYKSNTVLHKV